MQFFVVDKTFNNKFLIDVLSQKLEISKAKAKSIIDSKNILINSKKIWIAKYVVNTGDKISYPDSVKETTKKLETYFDVEIIYEDNYFYILNKPSGIQSNGEKSFENLIQKKFKSNNLHVVHRLDKDTSGCIIVSKNKDVFEKFKEVFQQKLLTKIYTAIVIGLSDIDKLTINSKLDGKDAITHIKVKERINRICILDIQIETGRKHQIRRHLRTRGAFILGDKEYYNKESSGEKFGNIMRQMLHAYRLSFKHPFLDKNIDVSAKLPTDFKDVVSLIKKNSV